MINNAMMLMLIDDMSKNGYVIECAATFKLLHVYMNFTACIRLALYIKKN